MGYDVNEEPKLIDYEGRQMVVMTRERYNSMIDAIEDAQDDSAAFVARAAAHADGFVPADVSRDIRSGKNPIAVWRVHRKLTQSQLAERAGMKQPAIGRLERGRWPAAHDSTLKKVAEALGAPLWTLRPHENEPFGERLHGAFTRYLRTFAAHLRGLADEPKNLPEMKTAMERILVMSDANIVNSICEMENLHHVSVLHLNNMAINRSGMGFSDLYTFISPEMSDTNVGFGNVTPVCTGQNFFSVGDHDDGLQLNDSSWSELLAPTIIGNPFYTGNSGRIMSHLVTTTTRAHASGVAPDALTVAGYDTRSGKFVTKKLPKTRKRTA